MSARAIGDILRPIIRRTEALYGFQQLLNASATAEAKKRLILAAWERGEIDDEDTQLLVEAYGLETA